MEGRRFDSSAASQMKHNKTVHDTKSAEVSSPDRRKPDIAQAAVQGVHAEDDKPAVAVSTTSKASVTPTYKALSGQKNKELPASGTKRNLMAEAFNVDEDSEEEEMPPEAKMRMRNLGKETRAAEGPNSFSKGKLGFCNQQKVMLRKLEETSETQVKK